MHRRAGWSPAGQQASVGKALIRSGAWEPSGSWFYPESPFLFVKSSKRFQLRFSWPASYLVEFWESKGLILVFAFQPKLVVFLCM